MFFCLYKNVSVLPTHQNVFRTFTWYLPLPQKNIFSKKIMLGKQATNVVAVSTQDDDDDVTLELGKLKATLLERNEEIENNASGWYENNVADDSFLRIATLDGLDSLIESISSRISRLRNDLSAAALSLAPNSDTNSFAASPLDAVETLVRLKQELDQCANELVSQNSLSKYEAEELKARQERSERIIRLENLVSALNLLASHQRYCAEFDRYLESGNVAEAVRIVDLLDACSLQMAKLAFTNAANSKNTSTLSATRVAKTARNQCHARRSSLQAFLDDALKTAINFDLEKQELTIKLNTKSERLQQDVRFEKVIEALRAMQLLESRLKDRVVQPILNMFLIPLIKNSNQLCLEQDLEHSDLPCLRLKHIAQQQQQQPVQNKPCQKVLDDVLTVLRFVWSEVLVRDSVVNTNLNLFANIESLLKDVLRDAIPDTFQELAHFTEDIVERVAKFDQELERIGAIGNHSPKLVEYLSNVEVTFAKKLRERYAERVRIVLREDLQVCQRVDEGEEPEFFIGNGEFAVPADLRVSIAIRKVVSIANEALVEAEAEAVPSVCSQALIQACRSSFDMLRVIVPFIRKDEIQTNPRCAMLHRNDCDYIAHHLVLLSHRHRSLRSLITVDLAPYFFDDAEDTFRKEINIRCAQIEAMFQQPNGFEEFSDILTRSDAIYKAWSDILPQHIVETTRSNLAEALANGVFQAICSADVSDLEKRTLLKRLTRIAEAVKARGASSKRIEQLRMALQPHMSLPLFADLVETDLQDWTPDNIVGLAHALFSKNSTPTEMKKFEDKIFYY